MQKLAAFLLISKHLLNINFLTCTVVVLLLSGVLLINVWPDILELIKINNHDNNNNNDNNYSNK